MAGQDDMATRLGAIQLEQMPAVTGAAWAGQALPGSCLLLIISFVISPAGEEQGRLPGA